MSKNKRFPVSENQEDMENVTIVKVFSNAP